MKRKGLFSLLILGVLVQINTVCYASGNLGPIYTWSSDYISVTYGSFGDQIGRWGSNTISLYRYNYNSSNSTFPFDSSLSSSVSSWNTVLGTNIYSSSSSSSNIRAYGGTANQLMSAGFTVSSDVLGNYWYKSKYYEGYWMYNNTEPKTSYVITSAELILIDDLNSSTNYMKPALHELGHCLGWIGHSTNAYDVMYWNNSSIVEVYSLTNRDKNHLSQVY